MNPRPAPLAAISFCVLAGCAPTGDFPSLAPRPIEYRLSGRPLPPCLDPGQNGGEIALETEAPLPVDDPALAEQIAALVEGVRSAETEFARALPAAEASVARAGGGGSESWIAAQQQLSVLTAAQGAASEALAGLEALQIDRGQQALSAADRAALTRALEEARRAAQSQQQALDRLQARVAA